MSEQATFDPDAFKASQRDDWEGAAAGWDRWHDVLEGPKAGQAQTSKLLEIARIGPGDTVLDVATGCGEPGLSAARAVQPGGRVVCSDLSGQMLACARRRAEAAGLRNVEFLEADAEALEFDEATFDAVLCRHGLQFLTDVAGTLRQYHRFLKDRGRLAAMVWGPPPAVGFSRALPVIVEELGLTPPPPSGPGIFALADRDTVAGYAIQAGFRDIETGTLPVVYETASPEDFTELVREISPPIANLVKNQPSEVAERVWKKVTDAWAPFTSTNGRTAVECQAIWLAGTR